MSKSLAGATETEIPEARHKGYDRKCAQCGERLPDESTRGRVAKRSLCADCALDGLPHTD